MNSHAVIEMRRIMQRVDWKLNSAPILFAHVQFELETHPAMYGSARTDENSSFPHFDLAQSLHTNRSSLRRRRC